MSEPTWEVSFAADPLLYISVYLKPYQTHQIKGEKKDRLQDISCEDAAKLFLNPPQGVFLSVGDRKDGWVVNLAFSPFSNTFYVLIAETPFVGFTYNQASHVKDFSMGFLEKMGTLVEEINSYITDVKRP